VLVLTEKETVGVYLLLQSHAPELDSAMARLRKRMEDSLLGSLTVGDFEDLAALYVRLREEPSGKPQSREMP
jgi:hypothetical protein